MYLLRVLIMLRSERSRNLTLNASAHFYLANVGTAWMSLNNPPQTGLQWSIVTYIDLRKRPDGIINTPPVASVVSPQYVTVNRTAQIKIPVFDANAGDDVRCRWSKYTPGYRRRRRHSDENVHIHRQYETVQRRNTNNDSGTTTCNAWNIYGVVVKQQLAQLQRKLL